ncbi:conjugative transposon protein TraM [Croceitalea marina]|uniref:Conjugative transposon protein TraM n=1 Tax=Croceitalea marina TaxID=1775166 RepID=A0ABW5MWQ4_9FLAO
MILEKNKIVFAGVIGILLIFLGSYGYILMTGNDEPEDTLTQPEVPQWEDTESEYSSKLEAIDALKEERETQVPSVYPEHMIDEKGYFNPDYMEYEKQRIIDSIREQRPYAENYQFDFEKKADSKAAQSIPNDPIKMVTETALSPEELGLEHQLFFAANPEAFEHLHTANILVAVDGKQVLRKNSRIRLRLVEAVILEGQHFPAHTVVFGTVRFRPNRVLLHITQIGQLPMDWEAYDLQDGMQGLYLENSLREEATREVAEDVVQDINIAGLPQVRGLKNVFQRRQRNLKITVLDGHQLLLQPNID